MNWFSNLSGARGNNLKSVDVDIPLGMFICVTGVSGSGKSTLINETLYPVISQHLYKSKKKPLPYGEIEGLELINKIVQINQALSEGHPEVILQPIQGYLPTYGNYLQVYLNLKSEDTK